MRTPARSGLLAAGLIGALSLATLTACGDSTVNDNESTTTSIAPLERAPRSSTATTVPSSERSAERDRDRDEEGAASSSRRTPEPRPAPQPQDQGAREIDEIPAPEMPRSPEDVRYLGALTDEEIDIEGVEEQLIGTAATVCEGGDSDFARSTLPAVAGQLIEQGRTDKSVDDVAALIEDAARNAYC